jgi:5-(carboxyamino)imidazole ribonucleotide synthase
MKRTIGFVGGGQLGRMLVEAARKLDFETVVLDPTPESPAGMLADRQMVGNFTDPKAVHALAKEVDVLTFEIESADIDSLHEIARKRPHAVHPLPKTLGIIKDKLKQKEFLKKHRIPVAPFRAVTNSFDVEKVAKQFGYPLVLKARRGAYDGRGNALITNKAEIVAAFEKLKGKELYIEKFIPFKKELAVVAVRTQKGEIATYPVVETIHENQICLMVLAPAPIEAKLCLKAQRLAGSVLRALGGAGVFGIEMFLTGSSKILINEIAPRVHNSGHFTIEACEMSQFEAHVRAVSGEPLRGAHMTTPAAVMINILGKRTGTAKPRGLRKAESLGGVTVHMYGKKETRPERKMGHITVVAKTLKEALSKAQKARQHVSI